MLLLMLSANAFHQNFFCDHRCYEDSSVICLHSCCHDLQWKALFTI